MKEKDDAPPRASDRLVEALAACIDFTIGGNRELLKEALEHQALTYPMNWRHERRQSKLLCKLLDAMVAASGAGIER
jgi:hypothetical protein